MFTCSCECLNPELLPQYVGQHTYWTTPKSHGRPGSDVRLVVSVVAAVRNTWFVI